MHADLFDKCSNPRLDDFRAGQAAGMLPWFVEMASDQGPEVLHDGRQIVMLGSNNYLGLTTDDRVVRAAISAIDRFGTGCTGSRLMNGTLTLHRELEEFLVEWVGGEASLVFTTGYAVNLGILSTLVGAGDRAFLDSECHASLLDGATLAAGSWTPFRHNSAETLRHRLEAWRKRGGDGALAVIDGVYSMRGDTAPVAAIAEVCSEMGARLLVDEAHALGVTGPRGAGSAAAAGVRPDLVMGTFSKSLASCGGFVTGPLQVIDHLRIACRPFLFTASGVPAAVAAALEAARIAASEDWRRDVVHQRASQLQTGLRQLGYDTGPDTTTAIVPVFVGDDWEAGLLWNQLLAQGVYTNCAVAPAVAAGGALLRTSVMATHTEEHITRALDAFEAVAAAAV